MFINQMVENIFRYDVNSLYPYVMKECSMPVGNPILFEGNIWKIDPKAFGLFEVEVASSRKYSISFITNKN